MSITKKIREKFGGAVEKMKQAIDDVKTLGNSQPKRKKNERRMYFRDHRGYRYLPSGRVYKMDRTGWRRVTAKEME